MSFFQALNWLRQRSQLGDNTIQFRCHHRTLPENFVNQKILLLVLMFEHRNHVRAFSSFWSFCSSEARVFRAFLIALKILYGTKWNSYEIHWDHEGFSKEVLTPLKQCRNQNYEVDGFSPNDILSEFSKNCHILTSSKSSNLWNGVRTFRASSFSKEAWKIQWSRKNICYIWPDRNCLRHWDIRLITPKIFPSLHGEKLQFQSVYY